MSQEFHLELNNEEMIEELMEALPPSLRALCALILTESTVSLCKELFDLKDRFRPEDIEPAYRWFLALLPESESAAHLRELAGTVKIFLDENAFRAYQFAREQGVTDEMLHNREFTQEFHLSPNRPKSAGAIPFNKFTPKGTP